MPPLRASQVETLRHFERHGSLTVYQLSRMTGRPIDSSREHLAGLQCEALLFCARPNADWLFGYHLTELGREALEGQQ